MAISLDFNNPLSLLIAGGAGGAMGAAPAALDLVGGLPATSLPLTLLAAKQLGLGGNQAEAGTNGSTSSFQDLYANGSQSYGNPYSGTSNTQANSGSALGGMATAPSTAQTQGLPTTQQTQVTAPTQNIQSPGQAQTQNAQSGLAGPANLNAESVQVGAAGNNTPAEQSWWDTMVQGFTGRDLNGQALEDWKKTAALSSMLTGLGANIANDHWVGRWGKGMNNFIQSSLIDKQNRELENKYGNILSSTAKATQGSSPTANSQAQQGSIAPTKQPGTGSGYQTTASNTYGMSGLSPNKESLLAQIRALGMV